MANARLTQYKIGELEHTKISIFWQDEDPGRFVDFSSLDPDPDSGNWIQMNLLLPDLMEFVER